MRRHARQRWVREAARRELHLVDLENLVGTGRITAEDVANVTTAYEQATGIADSALMISGTSSQEGDLAARFGWSRPGRFVWSPGPSGAEYALLADVAAGPLVPFGRVVIGSGDGIFAVLALGLRVAGAEVVVVSRRSSLSRTLRDIADEVVYLDDWLNPQPAHAQRPVTGFAA